jgi:hypothetical protein
VDRFDDVDYEILEAPQPAPRRRRRGLALVASAMIAGGLALGASALASSDDPEPVAPATPSKATKWDGRHHHGCRKGDGERRWHRDRDRGSGVEVLGLRH